MDFVTVPSVKSKEIEFANRVDVPRAIECWICIAHLFTGKDEQGRTSLLESDVPIPGDIYEVYLTGECSINWWNYVVTVTEMSSIQVSTLTIFVQNSSYSFLIHILMTKNQQGHKACLANIKIGFQVLDVGIWNMKMKMVMKWFI